MTGGTAKVQFRVLGPLEIVIDDQPVDVGGPRQRALLAMLLVHANRAVSADRLIDGLWAEQAPRRAAAGLQVLVSNLRRALEPDRPPRMQPGVLVTRPPGYLLVVAEPQLDAARFESLLATGQRALAAGRAAEARSALDEAIALWRGPALAEFAYEDFARSEAARLQELRTAALEERIQADLDLGRHGTAVADAEHLLDEHPLRERLWGLLMTGYYRSGRQADALRAFQQARSRLGEELGIDPSPSLQQLESDVLAQAPSLDWQPPAAGPASSPPPAAPPLAEPPVGAPDAKPLVGRAEELHRLQAAFGDAAAGRGRLVLVAGEAGVGKTRLVEELAAAAAGTGVLVAWGRCHHGDSAPPFWPWTQVLSAIVAPGGADIGIGPEGAAAARLLLEVPDARPGVAPPLADPAHARFRLCQDLTAYLRGVAGPRCVVVVLDDLHWADPASMELLTILASRLDGARLLVVGTYRDIEVDADHPLAVAMASLARQTFVERVVLTGMTEEESGRFIADAIGAEPTPELAGALHARTDGNPFFLTELLRLLEDQGPLSGHDHEAALLSPVPVGVRDVISQRFAQLTPTARTLLTVAAVAGREFDQPLLDLAYDIDDEEALVAVELAVSRGILTESPAKVGRYRFSHALIRETVYAGISGLRRARLHGRVGQALETLEADGEGSPVAELAYHFWNAVPAVGATKAVRYSVAAADLAAEQLDYERAEEHLRRALGLVGSLPAPERGPAEVGALARLGTLLAATRGQAAPEVDAAFSRATELCRQGDATRDATTALWGFFYSSYVRGELDAARAIADRLLAMAGDSANPEMVLAGHLAMGIASFNRGHLAAAHDHLGAGIEVADRIGDRSLTGVFQVDPRVYARCFHSLVLGLLDDPAVTAPDAAEPDAAEATAQEARRTADDLAHPFSLATASMFGAWLGFLREDPDSVGRHAAATVSLSEEHGFPLLAAVGKAFAGWAAARSGDAEAGAALVATGLTAFRGARTATQPLFLALEAEVEHLAGRPERALAILDQAVPVAPADEPRHYFDAAVHRLRAEILVASFPERTDEAGTGLRRSVAIAAAQGARSLQRRAATRLEAISGS